MFNRPSLSQAPQGAETTFGDILLPILVVGAIVGGAWYNLIRHLPAPETRPNQEVVAIPAPEPPPQIMPEAPPPPAPKSAPKVDDLVSLESVDGRAIKAKILVITEKTVFIRREDGQTFDLPVERLTAESKAKVEEHRLAKIHGGSVGSN